MRLALFAPNLLDRTLLCWRWIFFEHFGNFLLNPRNVFDGVVGYGFVRNAPPDGFLQLRIHEFYYEGPLFHDAVVGLNRIYELAFTTKSDNEAGICVHPYFLQSLCLQGCINVFSGMLGLGVV